MKQQTSDVEGLKSNRCDKIQYYFASTAASSQWLLVLHISSYWGQRGLHDICSADDGLESFRIRRIDKMRPASVKTAGDFFDNTIPVVGLPLLSSFASR
jgi:hypothetical protein